jgi:dTDP-4-amino-4,6-dideoxygalactose transaminase|tara:strand:- start:915 stop:1985 length:1071 start_codon:yes stop_codon:yes gene_type:complete
MSEPRGKYPVSKPSIGKREWSYVLEAVESGWVSSKGKFVEELEVHWASFCQKKHAVACSSGTTALTLALAALKIGPGDEVIVPEFTMIASAWAVNYVGATPVFVDCDDSLSIDVKSIREKITPRTKAIMPVHIYGRLCNMTAIQKIAREFNLRVVEDACEVHGAEGVGQSDIQCYSLFGNKIITSGEGGLITTDNPELAWQLSHLRTMSFDEDHSFLHPKLGYNFRMSNLQAAVAKGQVESIDRFLEKRELIERWYDDKLGHLSIGARSVLWMYDIVLPSTTDRDKLISLLAEKNIETRRFFKPMSQQPMYFDKEHTRLRAYDFSLRGLYLPTYVELERSDVNYISEQLLTFLKVC